MAPVVSIAFSVLAILLCGGLGAAAGFALVTLAGWSGTPAAIVAAVIGVAVATLLWTAGSVLLRKLGWLR